MRLDFGHLSDVGQRKKKNEDYYGVSLDRDIRDLKLFDEGAMVCVADGLGGHFGGEIASKLAVSILREALPKAPDTSNAAPDDPNSGLLTTLKAGYRSANESIHKTNLDNLKFGRPMGTTLLTAVITPKKTFIGNVGDSRCYHFRDGEVINVTEDHSWVDEQVKQGLMTKDEAERDNRKNLVTRCIGTAPEVEVDTYVWFHAPGDRLLLCTDGLINMVSDAAIANEFAGNLPPQQLAQRLVKMANDNGGKDNITVVIVDIAPGRLALWKRKARRVFARWGRRGLWFIAWLAWGALCGAAGYWLARHG